MKTKEEIEKAIKSLYKTLETTTLTTQEDQQIRGRIAGLCWVLDGEN
jgi:uncharacterized coiled-coil DUF342 family protein